MDSFRSLRNPHAASERLAQWADEARRSGRVGRADSLLLMAWEAFDRPARDDARQGRVVQESAGLERDEVRRVHLAPFRLCAAGLPRFQPAPGGTDREGEIRRKSACAESGVFPRSGFRRARALLAATAGCDRRGPWPWRARPTLASLTRPRGFHPLEHAAARLRQVQVMLSETRNLKGDAWVLTRAVSLIVGLAGIPHSLHRSRGNLAGNCLCGDWCW